MRSEAVYVSLGSNMGDRFGHLNSALHRLRQHPRIAVECVSSFYETAPQDVLDQPWFLNAVAALTTDLTPEELLHFLQELEREEGRDRREGERRGPRTLDLDILLFGERVMDSELLTIPHPRMWERRFVLEPLLEIAGELFRSDRGERIRVSLDKFAGQEIRRLE